MRKIQLGIILLLLVVLSLQIVYAYEENDIELMFCEVTSTPNRVPEFDIPPCGGGNIPYITAPRKIVFLIHGMKGDASVFHHFTHGIVFHYLGEGFPVPLVLTSNTQRIEIINELQRWNFPNKQDLIFFFRVQFSDNTDYVHNQVSELFTIVQHFTRIFGQRTSFSLVGSSKGGLVAVNFATRHPRIICKIVTIGTPFNHEFIHDIANNFDLDKTIGCETQMRLIRNSWNAMTQRPPIHALAIETNRFLLGQWSDLLVSSRNASGTNFNSVYPTTWRRHGNSLYDHFNQLNRRTTLSFVMEIFR